MADAADSKSADSNIVWVQVPFPPLRRRKLRIACDDFLLSV